MKATRSADLSRKEFLYQTSLGVLAKVVFFDTGHFALETHHEQISDQIRSFLTGLVQSGKL
jgi:hypothetical protein